MLIARFFLVIVLCVTAGSNLVLAQENTEDQQQKSLKIAVIDMKAVRQNSTAMASIREQINAFRSSFQKQVQAEEETLRAANQELARQRSILSAEAFAEERRKFEERLAEVQRNVQRRRSDLEQARELASAQVQEKLNEIIATIARERGLGLILPRSHTVLAIRSLEITEDVLTQLNTSLPTVSVQAPGQ